jgi:chromate transporter
MGERPGLGELCRLLLKHAAFTVGGGSVTMVELERDVVQGRGWLDLSRYRTIYGLARLTPGTSILALATGIGWDMYRWPGAIAALAVSAIPGSILAAFLAAGYEQVYGNALARSFLAGSAAAVCGLIGASIWRMVSPYLAGAARIGSVAVFVTALGISFLGLSPFPVFIALGVAGYLLGKNET